MTTIPRIRVSGDPLERGRQYGRQARSRVERSLAGYERVFRHYAGWTWPEVLRHASRYRAAIAAFSEDILAELRGIAEGVGQDLDAVLALNCRTEIMYAAVAGRGLTAAAPPPAECSTLAMMPSRTADHHLLAGQNWDWLLHAADTIVCLEVERSDGPGFLTVVEAGLLAKFGVNTAGITVLTNALVCAGDRGDPGVPYHVLLRGLHDACTLPGALRRIQATVRAASATYLLASADGTAVAIETAPGGHELVSLVFPEGGALIHTNHFIRPWSGLRDLSVWESPDSPFRLARLAALVDEAGSELGRDDVIGLLRDHANRPGSVCAHPDPTLPEPERSRTICSAVVDCTTARLWLAGGQPCETSYEAVDWHGAARPAGDRDGRRPPVTVAGSRGTGPA